MFKKCDELGLGEPLDSEMDICDRALCSGFMDTTRTYFGEKYKNMYKKYAKSLISKGFHIHLNTLIDRRENKLHSLRVNSDIDDGSHIDGLYFRTSKDFLFWYINFKGSSSIDACAWGDLQVLRSYDTAWMDCVLS